MNNREAKKLAKELDREGWRQTDIALELSRSGFITPKGLKPTQQFVSHLLSDKPKKTKSKETEFGKLLKYNSVLGILDQTKLKKLIKLCEMMG